MMHLIKFMCSDSKVAPIEVECSCGARLPARSGIDAMRVAREHKLAEVEREHRQAGETSEVKL